MTMIFCSSAEEDRACADQMRQGLEAAGYTIWQAPASPSPRDQSYPYLIENAILGSAAVVVLWSQRAASFAWVKRHILTAQGFFKPVITVRLDETSLPSTLLGDSFAGQAPCSEIVTHLLPHLPSPRHTDALLELGEQAAHPHIRVRKEAIEQAVTMLRQGEHREEVLTILEYLARSDLINAVREKAADILKAQQKAGAQFASPAPQDMRHLFGVRCQNGHITTFDRREVCSKRKEIMRGLDELNLTCPTCKVTMAVDVDCEGY